MEELNEKLEGKKAWVFLDNLSVHRSKAVEEKVRTLNIELIFNAPYSPELNAIEHLWNVAKQYFRKNRL